MAAIGLKFLFHGNILTGSEAVQGEDKFHGDLVGLQFLLKRLNQAKTRSARYKYLTVNICDRCTSRNL